MFRFLVVHVMPQLFGNQEFALSTTGNGQMALLL